MRLPKELNTVTPLSKYLAILLFIAFPIVGFFLGMRYQEMLTLNQQSNDDFMSKSPTPTQIIFCPEDIKTCPDGTRVTRQPPTCEFAACPTPTAEKCAEYTNLGKTVTVCASCGNDICEPYETCTSSNIGKDASTTDCGFLECPQDCKK